MELKLVAVVLVLSLFSVSADKARFDNYRLYNVDIETHDQLSVLRELSETSDSYDFWDTPRGINSKVEVLVAPHKFAHFSELLEKFGFNSEIVSNDWQEILNMSEPDPKKEAKAPSDMNWTQYHSVATAHEWIEWLKTQFPNWVTVEDIGTSFEGRPLKVIKISKNPAQRNRAIFIEANIHAREWISSATATWVVDQLLRSTDPEVVEISNNVDWYILTHANPDGFEHSRNSNRNWRKTRSPASALCVGVDPNRNFAYNWLTADETGDLGASTQACSDTFAGPRPFSESETLAIENFVIRNRDRLDVYISFHSYAHMILTPMGHTRVRVPNIAELLSVGEAAADRLFAKHGIRYTVGITTEILYAASGTSHDHAYGSHGIKIAYTYEMRGNGDYGRYGFALPPQFIIPNSEEVLQSLIGLVHRARDYGYLHHV